jgi:hypothetical protein
VSCGAGNPDSNPTYDSGQAQLGERGYTQSR